MPNRKFDSDPAAVAVKRKALTAKPLFYGVIVFTIIVIAGPTQPSANKYSSASAEIDTQKLVYVKRVTIIVGIPIAPQNMQTYAFVM